MKNGRNQIPKKTSFTGWIMEKAGSSTAKAALENDLIGNKSDTCQKKSEWTTW
jgi:hypothetical protein